MAAVQLVLGLLVAFPPLLCHPAFGRRLATHVGEARGSSAREGGGGSWGFPFWDSCSKMLKVEFTLAQPVAHMVRLFYANWTDAALFDKALPSGCVKSFRGHCKQGRVEKSRTCQGHTEDLVITDLNMWGGIAGFKRTSPIHAGEVVRLNVPGGGDGCSVELGHWSSEVPFWRSEVSFSVVDPAAGLHDLLGFMPQPESLESVVGSAVELFGDGTAACELRKDPAYVALGLLGLAEASRAEKDGVDGGAQTLLHLWSLHFEESSRYQFITTRDSWRKLAADFARVDDFRRMSLGELDAEVARPEQRETVQLEPKVVFGIRGLAHYYRGLARWDAAAEGEEAKPRALIFTCSFGGGHRSAASATSAYLTAAGFSVTVLDTTWDPAFKDDSVQIAAKFFNEFILRRQLYAPFNLLDNQQELLGPLTRPCPSPACNSPRKHQFRAAVLDHRPDLLVSVYHMEIMPILEVAKDLGNLPLLHLGTDIDIKMTQIFHVAPVYPRFLVGVPFDLEQSFETTTPLKRSQTFLAGYPVRGAFLRPADPAEVARERRRLVPAGTKVMLVMTGEGGQDVEWPYELAASGIGQRLHVIVVAGGNGRLVERLRTFLPGNVSFPDGRTVWQGSDRSVTVEVARDAENTNTEKPFYILAPRLAMLMDMADVVLTKPGGGTTAEIAYRGVPAIFDLSITLLHWERFTVDIFVEQGRAATFRRRFEFRRKLRFAMYLGRSLKLVKDANGRFIDSAANVVRAAKTLLYETECRGCQVL